MSFNQEALQSAFKKLDFLEEKKDSIYIDGDCHLSNPDLVQDSLKKIMENEADYFQGRAFFTEDLINSMDISGIDMCLIWQNPAATAYYQENYEKNFKSLLEANRAIYQASTKYNTRFIPAGWTDPKNLGEDLAKEMVDICIDNFAFPIIKINPAQNAFPIDSEKVMKLVDHIAKRGASVAFHFGADTPYTPAEGLQNVISQFPDNTFIGVHMGGGGAGYIEADDLYKKARELGLRSSNLYFSMSAKRDMHMESDIIRYLEAGDEHKKKLFFASDAPYGNMAFCKAGFQSMLELMLEKADSYPDKRINSGKVKITKQDIQGFMGGNLARFTIKAYKKMFEANGLGD